MFLLIKYSHLCIYLILQGISDTSLTPARVRC